MWGPERRRNIGFTKSAFLGNWHCSSWILFAIRLQNYIVQLKRLTDPARHHGIVLNQGHENGHCGEFFEMFRRDLLRRRSTRMNDRR